jgi:hypothetical protein
MGGRAYLPGQALIARRLGMFATGEWQYQAGEKPRPPTLADSVDDTLSFGYVYLTQLFPAEQVDQHKRRLVDAIAETGRALLAKAVPLVCPFLFVHRFGQFEFVEHDLGSLYAGKFPDIWRLWMWIFEAEKPLEAYAAFNTAILLFVLPTIVKDGMTPQSLDEKWATLTADLRLPELLNLAQYLLVC